MPTSRCCVPFRSTVRNTLAPLAVLLVMACRADTTEPSKTNPVTIEVSRYAVSLAPTTDTALTATITGTDINEPITWTSSAPAVATVRDDGPFGVVRGVAEGTATVYAVRKSDPSVKSAPVTITVARIPALRAFTVDTALQPFIKGDSRTFTLNPTFAEARATATYAFTSSNTAVATVHPTTGVVTAVGVGSATVTATATGGGSGLIANTLSATAQILVGELQSRFRRITAGAGHSCALKSTGEAFCWGSNSSGQLGDGTLNSQSTPTAVVGGLTFTEISAGFAHTCGLTTAGAVYCWGINSQGRLGDGTTTMRLVPTPMRSPLTFTALEVGGVHTCAITAAGEAYCVGDIAVGQQANGVDLPTSLPKPIQLPGVVIKTITSGLTNTCVTSTTDVGYCWGIVTVSGNTLIPSLVAGSETSVGMYALGQFVKCVLSTAGRLSCPFGLGDVTLNSLPKAGPPFPYVLGVVLKSIIAGDSHACAIGLQNDAYCWGSNVDGRLGAGAGSQSQIKLVSGGFKWAELAAGATHTCGITTTNQVYCWGGNFSGQLGSAGPSSSTPKLVPFTP